MEGNSQLTDDTKGPKLIANLVKDGNFGMPYLPEKLYAEFRGAINVLGSVDERSIRFINRMHREMNIHFPEYKDALGKVDGAFSLELLKQAPFPEDMLAPGESGIRQIWHDAKLWGRGYSRAGVILQYAQASIVMRERACAGRLAVKWFIEKILGLDGQLAGLEAQINQKCQEIPHGDKIRGISGIGVTTLSGILAEMGDISRFDDVREIQKLSGLGLVACSTGKHKGETRISHRGANGSDTGCSNQLSRCGGSCGGIQKTSCLLYDESRESAQEAVVADCDSLQVHNSDEGNGI
ncbi:transposase [Enterocloster clostridioformis]|uniref:transposase n=1 Tax=Enterocloster clostridioformis TaxID=1531 RepID=UPI0026767ECC|nr:transposase [Enterocloster clostridioformis]